MTFDSVGLGLENYLTYLARRQEIIAANIANADTPGYKTLDVELPTAFSGVFEEARASVVEARGLPARNDGNNVSIDREARLLSENDVKFSLATQLIKSQIKGLRLAIEEGRSA